MSIELHIHFTFLCLYASVFYSGFISLFFLIQALKNIAAISLAISYPNKSTQLLNMSPWEQLTGRGNSLQELGGHVEGGAHVPTQLAHFDNADEWELPELPLLWLHMNHTVPPWTGNSRSTFYSLSVFFALLVNTVYCVTEFTWNEQFWSLLFFLKFCFYLKKLGLRTWSVPKFTALKGIRFPLSAFSSY